MPNRRHNAFEVDWDGNVWAQGSLEGIALILKSSTAGSEKRFVIRVNDEGQLSAQDIDTLNFVMTVNVSSGKTLVGCKESLHRRGNHSDFRAGESISCEIRTLVLCGIFVSILWPDVHGEKTGMQCDRQHHGKHLTA